MSKINIIRIATRSSKLALWQAEEVKKELEAHGVESILVPIESTGDLQLTQPIYAMGISGVFTRQLDIALLEGTADIAVHSLKDVPTTLATGLTLCATLQRGAHEDVAIIKDRSILEEGSNATIATSSLRRIAQWRARYPTHHTIPIRGNVQTRMRKFNESAEMDGVIFAKAGLERVDLLPADAVVLDWMIPAPSQGIVGIVCRTVDTDLADLCSHISHIDSFAAGTAERQFLHTLMGGCSVPISAYSCINGGKLHFTGAIHSFKGDRSFVVKRSFDSDKWADAGRLAAEELLTQPGMKELLEEIRTKKWDHEDTID